MLLPRPAAAANAMGVNLITQETTMDIWTKTTEFLACGLMVLPAELGIGMNSFEVFAATLGLMQILLIAVTIGGPTVPPPDDDEPRR